MLDCWLLDLIDCLRYEEDKIAGNTRDRGREAGASSRQSWVFSSQPWLSKAYLSPLMAQGYIAQTLPKKPKSPLQRYRLLRKGKDVLA